MLDQNYKISIIGADQLKTGKSTKDKKNLCVNLFENTKRNYFDNVDLKMYQITESCRRPSNLTLAKSGKTLRSTYC